MSGKSRLSSLLFLALVPLVAPLSATPCDNALPLPLDQSIHGYGPSLYALEIVSPGLLVIEAPGSAVRFLGRGCRKLSSNLPLPAIAGRHVHRVVVPGTYFAEVAAKDDVFRLAAWHVRSPGIGLLKDGEDDDGPREPMDEWDELILPPGNGEAASAAWREVAGHGVIEVGDGRVRFNAWCPWAERPELLSTFTCARRLRLGVGGAATVASIGDDEDVVGVTLTAGRLSASAGVSVYDAGGRLVAEASAGEPAELAAGRYFVRWTASAEPIRLELW